jgi:RNAse (barnase) inhibitor barstar
MEYTDRLPTFPPHVFVAEMDGKKARTLRGFYPRIAKALLFPDYFGKNLDALFDCLCSLEVVGKQSVVLLVRNADSFLDKEKPEKRAAALDVLRDAQKPENRSDGVQFRAIGVKN